MTNIKVRFPFEPQPKLRPRFHVRCNHVATFTPPATKIFENQVAEYYKNAARGFCFEQGTPIAIELEFGIAIPKSTSKKRKADMAAGYILPTKKPDIDNLTKSVMDALNGIAWHDDAQVCSLQAGKYYTDAPYFQMIIRELG